MTYSASENTETTLSTAFKEWAVICRAIATGRQDIILRKGGIVEPGGSFQLVAENFYLPDVRSPIKRPPHPVSAGSPSHH